MRTLLIIILLFLLKESNAQIVHIDSLKESSLAVNIHNKSSLVVNIHNADTTKTHIRICTPSRSSLTKKNQPLFIVDGKKMNISKLEKIDPQKINAVNILKGDEAIRHYGRKGKNGVIIVTTK